MGTRRYCDRCGSDPLHNTTPEVVEGNKRWRIASSMYQCDTRSDASPLTHWIWGDSQVDLCKKCKLELLLKYYEGINI